MIKIVKNGREKEFFARCFKCATDFTYMLEDVEAQDVHEYSNDDMVLHFSERIQYQTVICPVCGARRTADKLTREEAERLLNMPYYISGYKA